MKTKITLFVLAMVFGLMPTFAFAATIVSGDVTPGTVWTKTGSPYLLSAPINVPAGVTLTIEPGVVVKPGQSNTGFFVSGTLNVLGTTSDPAYFTSINDHTIGGTEGGSQWGDYWPGIMANQGSVVHLEYTNIRNASAGITNRGGTVTVSNSSFTGTSAVLTYGVYHVSGTTDISATTFLKTYSILRAQGTGTISLADNVFSDNSGTASFDLSNGLTFTNTNNRVEGPGVKAFILSSEGEGMADQTWEASVFPYVISGMNVPAGKTLTILPGTIIKFLQNNSPFTVNGTLDIQGTKESPVYFTSLNDDSIGGDTDGGSTAAYIEQWLRITLNTGAIANIDHAIFHRGGYGYESGVIINNGGTATITNSEISGSAGYGILHTSGTTIISESVLSANSWGAIWNTTSSVLNAENNYWGSPAGPYHATNLGGLGNNRVSDNVDFTPWLIYDPMKEMPVVPTLASSTVIEDDGINDTKGVADKTNFTFNVLYTGATAPSDVTLWTNANDTTNSYPLTISDPSTGSGQANDGDYTNGEWYTFTGTFPKGHYGYHFEANGGAARFPAIGELMFTTGYSNVAFLPGIKASRLFKQKENCLINCEDQLWEPNWWTDTNELIMNSDGTSENENIYTKTDAYLGTIDQANILPGNLLRENFYVSFLDFMKEMKQDGDIADWKALPYDWRLAFPSILNQGNATVDEKIFYDDRYATGTPYILQEIRALAKSSDTGKVTIIGHSMGGLLAKKLLHDYVDITSFTDTFILVDSPQLGTPQAIATLLHGTNENIPNNFGFFSDAKTGRKVAQNMPSVYTLLPSKSYAERVKDEGKNYTALISQDISLQNFSDSLWNTDSILNYYRSNYATTTITSYDALTDFLIGRDGHLSSLDNDIIHPKLVQLVMFAEAQVIHDEIDNWTPPETMRVVQIAGWGIPETIRSITYKGKKCLLCSSYSFDVVPEFTFDGDGTVVLPSQIAMDTETYFVDLYRNNIAFKKDRTHGSILEADDVTTLISNIIQNKNNPALNFDHIKTDISQLDKNGLKKLVRLSLHSPVKVDVTDTNGSHVGISASSTPERTVYDTQMPNSYYLEMGEGKYLGFSLEASTTIQLQGTGTGTFTLNLEQYQGDAKEGTQTFTDIPVSTTTKATLVINTLTDAKELALDQNGDGTIDSVVFTDENKEAVTFQTLKDELQTLSTKEKKAFLEKAQSAEKQFLKENWKSAREKLLELKKEISKLSNKKEHGQYQIEKTETLRIGAIIDTLIGQIEQNIQEIEKKKHHDEHEDKGKKKDGEKERENED